MERYAKFSPNNVKAIPGFSGCFMVITGKPWRTGHDSVECSCTCPAGASVVTASRIGKLITLTPWRCKKAGKEYGAQWVAMRDDNGKKKHFRLNALALDLFGEDWRKVQNEIQDRASLAALGDLF